MRLVQNHILMLFFALSLVLGCGKTKLTSPKKDKGNDPTTPQVVIAEESVDVLKLWGERNDSKLLLIEVYIDNKLSFSVSPEELKKNGFRITLPKNAGNYIILGKWTNSSNQIIWKKANIQKAADGNQKTETDAKDYNEKPALVDTSKNDEKGGISNDAPINQLSTSRTKRVFLAYANEIDLPKDYQFHREIYEKLLPIVDSTRTETELFLVGDSTSLKAKFPQKSDKVLDVSSGLIAQESFFKALLWVVCKKAITANIVNATNCKSVLKSGVDTNNLTVTDLIESEEIQNNRLYFEMLLDARNSNLLILPYQKLVGEFETLKPLGELVPLLPSLTLPNIHLVNLDQQAYTTADVCNENTNQFDYIKKSDPVFDLLSKVFELSYSSCDDPQGNLWKSGITKL